MRNFSSSINVHRWDDVDNAACIASSDDMCHVIKRLCCLKTAHANFQISKGSKFPLPMKFVRWGHLVQIITQTQILEICITFHFYSFLDAPKW